MRSPSLLILLFFMCCKSQIIVGNSEQENLWKPLAEKELGKSISTMFNSKSTFALCQQVSEEQHFNKTTKYVVVSTRSNEIVLKGSFKSGYVKWVSEESIEVASTDKFSTDLKISIIPIKSNNPK